MNPAATLLLFLLPALASADGPGGHHHHHHDHNDVQVSSSYSAAAGPAPASSSSYTAPSVAPVYNAPSNNVPTSSYSAPAPAPAPTYNAPAPAAPTYSAPSSSSSNSGSTAYSAAATSAAVSQGNLYYYYYPVAAYPIHNKHQSSKGSHGHAPTTHVQSESDISPLLFLLVPLVLLLLAVPLIALIGANVNNDDRRSFGGSAASKFGNIAELRAAVDSMLDKYVTALESQECMDRIVCELGTKASDLPYKPILFR